MVRVCEATYDATLVVKEGIQVLVSSHLQTCERDSIHLLNQSQCRFFYPLLCVTALNTPAQLLTYMFSVI